MMGVSLCTDRDFIAAWRDNGGNIEKVSEATGIKLRGVYYRRKGVEERHGIKLNTEKTAVKAIIRHHKARINIEIENAVLPIGGDVHIFPGEKTTIQRAFIKYVKDLKPAYVVLVGDVFDGARISRHPKIGFLESKPSVAKELKAVGEYLSEVESAAPKGSTLIWCLGNHDARYENYLAQNAPEMEGVEGMTLKDRFPRWLPCWSVHINEGKDGYTVIKHRYHNGIHASYNNTLKSGVNIITGHLHKLDSRKWTDYRGNRYGVDAGFMADVDGEQFVHYTEDNSKDWTSGFPVITFKKGKMLRPEFVQKWSETEVEFRGQIHDVG